MTTVAWQSVLVEGTDTPLRTSKVLSFLQQGWKAVRASNITAEGMRLCRHTLAQEDRLRFRHVAVTSLKQLACMDSHPNLPEGRLTASPGLGIVGSLVDETYQLKALSLWKELSLIFLRWPNHGFPSGLRG